MIAQLDLPSAFLYDSVPSRTASAFLTAVATNNSSLPLLPGPLSVYLNNSFVSRVCALSPSHAPRHNSTPWVLERSSRVL